MRWFETVLALLAIVWGMLTSPKTPYTFWKNFEFMGLATLPQPICPYPIA